LFFGLSAGVTIIFAFLLFYTGVFGGADAKALMCIAIALPFAPIGLINPVFQNGISPLSQVLFPLTIFINSVLFSALSGVYLLIRNLVWHKKTGTKMFGGTLTGESVGKKFLVMITGYKVSIATLKAKWHVYPLEDLEEAEADAVKRKLLVVPKDEGRDQIVERLSKAVDAKKIDPHVWATPGLPMLIFVTLGLLVAVFFGDVVWMLVRLFLG
jgi:archaeal preflagellin peptidase FlaK